MPMDCPGCLVGWDVPVSGQLSLVKQGVRLIGDTKAGGAVVAGEVENRWHEGSRGVRPSQSTAALIFAKTLGAMLGPELAVVETHLKASDSGLENGCGCSPSPTALSGYCSLTPQTSTW